MNTDNQLISGPLEITILSKGASKVIMLKNDQKVANNKAQEMTMFCPTTRYGVTIMRLRGTAPFLQDTSVSKIDHQNLRCESTLCQIHLNPLRMKSLPTMRMVCQPRQDRSGTWCRDPKIGRGHEVQISEPCGLSVGVIARRPLPPLPQAKMWLSGKKIKQQIV